MEDVAGVKKGLATAEKDMKPHFLPVLNPSII
jgi:hypothetical protein